MSERWRVALLLAVAMLVYGNTLLNSFTMDDELYILRNPAVTSPSLKGLFEATKSNNIFRPITFSTFALNWAVEGAQPFGYHLFNLLLNAAVALLLYLVLRTLLEAVPHGTTVAFAAALLFAVHPIHTEAVASIVGRSELLAAGFLLAAWLLHLRDKHILSLLCFALALFSKESAVAFVPLVPVGDYARARLKPLHRYGWIAGVAVLYLAVLWHVQGGRFGANGVNFLDNPLTRLPASLRIPNALRIAWKYVGLHVYPATLSCEYSYNAILLYSNWQHTVPAVVAAAFVLALWIWALWTKQREWVLAGAIYLGGFAVTSNLLVPTGTIMAERLAYLPSAGFCLLVALLWIRLENHQRKLAWAVFGIVLAALGIRTMVRNRDWRDNFTLYLAGVRAVPESAKMHANLGGVYFYRDQLDDARTEFQTALRIYPDFPEAMEYYGLVEARLGQDQEALRLLVTALYKTRKDNINYDFMAVNLASHFMKLGNNDDALKILDGDIAMSPGYARAWSTRAAIRYARGEVAAARDDAQTAARLDPADTQAQNLLRFMKAPASGAPVP
jgi:tetratricopeptide (TPR) repeat protein